jgi:prepilin-type N-terminal cleavage/methylation domain-containing protein
MTTATRSRSEGFTLIELLVAMTVTLVISGAIFGLLTGGQNAFRKEPELTDRQQNIRVAMNLIQKDVGTAGIGMGPFFQVFRNNQDGTGIQGPNGLTDDLEVYGNDGTCPDAPARPGTPTQGSNLNTWGPIPACYLEDSFVLVIYGKDGKDIGGKWGFAHESHAGETKFNFPPGQAADYPQAQINSPQDLENWVNGDAGSGTPVRMAPIMIYRYEIANDADGVPGLWRSHTGGLQIDGGGYVAPPDPDGNWQLVARGIEDMQVQYRTGAGWDDTPGAVASPDYNTITREIRVTLSSRSTVANLTGQVRAANAAIGAAQNAVRGSLTSTMAARATLFYMSQASPAAVPWQ